MEENNKTTLVAVGNVYLDTNIFGVETKEKDILEVGKEYFANRAETVLGGSSVNFLLQAKNLNSEVAFIGQVGNDAEGERIKQLLNERGVSTDLVVTSATETTSLATNLVLAHHGGFVGLHWGSASRNLSPEQIDLESSLIANTKAIYFGGTAKQEKIFAAFPTLLEKIHAKQIQIFADPNRFPPDTADKDREILLKSLKYIDCYLPNEEELLNLTGKDSIDDALEVVFDNGTKMVVVKMGKSGCRIKTQAEDFVVPGFQVEAMTTVGAGDSFNAGFITQLLTGNELKECGRYANAVAAIKVSTNTLPTPDAVMTFLQFQS